MLTSLKVEIALSNIDKFHLVVWYGLPQTKMSRRNDLRSLENYPPILTQSTFKLKKTNTESRDRGTFTNDTSRQKISRLKYSLGVKGK